MHRTILVKIASYRDDELPKTVASLLGAAKYPERLRFAIVHQYGPETQTMLDMYRDDMRFRLHDMNWREARGVGLARQLSDRLYDGEDFFLQIDSHMRAKQDWDESLEQEWMQLNDPRGILSSYPPAYHYDEHDEEVYEASNPNRLVPHELHSGFIPIFFGKELPKTTSKRGAFAAGGLQFGPGQVCLDVEYEPRICFIGEEFVHSMRLYAAGYRVYSVEGRVLSHLYLRSQNQKNAHHFWQDFQGDTELAQVYTAMNTLSHQVIRGYFEGREGLSSAQVRAFEDFVGVDIATGKVHEATYQIPDMPMATDDSWRARTIEMISQQ
ncbi:hypothetical protein I8H89_03210 [Candidatus Saccharibacteria bacterium]|nr:hypothetical protein [Candidatus Saccharibacteria bacterium]